MSYWGNLFDWWGYYLGSMSIIFGNHISLRNGPFQKLLTKMSAYLGERNK